MYNNNHETWCVCQKKVCVCKLICIYSIVTFYYRYLFTITYNCEITLHVQSYAAKAEDLIGENNSQYWHLVETRNHYVSGTLVRALLQAVGMKVDRKVNLRRTKATGSAVVVVYVWLFRISTDSGKVNLSSPAVFEHSMVSHRQTRVWRYVEEGSLLKLKSYLRKHRDLDVNFSRGKRQRSPLHLACCLEDDAVLRLLLKHGADVLQRDRRGDTALHVAASRALKHGKTGEERQKLASDSQLVGCQKRRKMGKYFIFTNQIKVLQITDCV